MIHCAEFMPVPVLFFRALRFAGSHFFKVHAALLSFLSSILFAFSDEVHQSFVPYRTMSIQDFLADTIGIVIGMMLIYFIYGKKKGSA